MSNGGMLERGWTRAKQRRSGQVIGRLESRRECSDHRTLEEQAEKQQHCNNNLTRRTTREGLRLESTSRVETEQMEKQSRWRNGVDILWS